MTRNVVLIISDHQRQVLHDVEQFMETAQYAPAIALLNQTLETYPHFYFGWLKLSQCLFDADFKDKAVDVAKQAEQFDPLT
jgi:tetratricopeptide (TPR) repeat protein